MCVYQTTHPTYKIWKTIRATSVQIFYSILMGQNNLFLKKKKKENNLRFLCLKSK